MFSLKAHAKKSKEPYIPESWFERVEVDFIKSIHTGKKGDAF